MLGRYFGAETRWRIGQEYCTGWVDELMIIENMNVNSREPEIMKS